MVNGSDKNGNSCLHLAAAGGHANVVKVLARVGGIHLQAPDNNGRTPLHWAAAAGHETTVAALLDLDCNPTCTDAANKTPLEYAKSNRSSTQKSCVRLLKKVAQDWQGGQRISRKHLTGAPAGEDASGLAAAAAAAAGAGGGAGAAVSGRAKLQAVAKISRAFAASKSTKGGLAAVRTAAQRVKNSGGNLLTEPERRLSADPGLGTLSEEAEVAEALPIEDLDAYSSAAAVNNGPDPMRPQHDPLPGLGSHASSSPYDAGAGAAGAAEQVRPVSRSGEIPALKPRGSITSMASVDENAELRRTGEAADLSVLRDMVRGLQNDLSEARAREDSKLLRISTLEEHVQFWKDQARQSCPNCVERNDGGGSGDDGGSATATASESVRGGGGGGGG